MKVKKEIHNIRYLILAVSLLSLLLSACSNLNKTEIKNDDEKVSESVTKFYDPQLAKSHFIQGVFFEHKGEFESAVKEYKTALSYDDAAGINYALGSLYMNLRKFALAAVHLKRAIEIDSINNDYKLKLATLYTSTYQEQEAEKLYNEILSKDSSSIDAYYNLAAILSVNKPLKSIEVYEKLNRILGEDLSIYFKMVELYNRMNDFANSATILEKMLYLAPSNVMIKNALIDLYLHLKNYDKAENLLLDILTEDPKDYVSRELLAQIYVEKGNWEKANSQFANLLNVDSVDVNTKFRVALTFFEKSYDDSTYINPTFKLFQHLDSLYPSWKSKIYLAGLSLLDKDTIKTKYYLDSIMVNEPGLEESWFRVGGLFFDKRKYEQSLFILRKGYELYKESYLFNFLIGINYLQLNSFSTSYTYLYKAQQIDGKQVDCLSSLGYVLGKIGKYEDAIYYLNIAMSLNEKDLNVLSTLATLYNDSGKFAECDSIYKIAFSHYPENALLLNNYAYSLAERKISLDLALEYSKKAVKQDSTNDSYLDTLGWIYYQLGDLNNAEKYVRMAVDLGSTSAEVLEHMGDIYYKLGNLDLAKAYWQKALEKDSNRKSSEKRLKEGKL